MFENQNILITGGTGSFGKAMIPKLLEGNAKKVIVYSRDELKQWELKNELKESRVKFIIGDIRNYNKLRESCEDINLIIHAAALKHVPVCEDNPYEAIQTNVMGTENVIKAALSECVNDVIALSTDKAVEPNNLYGATKMCLEKLFINANHRVKAYVPRFSVVRYGNVLNSRGSVIPKWINQKNQNKPLTLTDNRMTRFFLTLDRATNFVKWVYKEMQGGEIFIPQIPSMSLEKLAKLLSKKITVTGIRPGEKLHETLISKQETGDVYLLNGNYVIYERSKIERSAVKLKENFEFSSGTNTEWLGDDQMVELLREFGGFVKRIWRVRK